VSSFDSEGREYDDRTWGNYTDLDDKAPNYKVRCIVVLPDKRLSCQRHAKRAEYWFIVSDVAMSRCRDVATSVLVGVELELAPGQRIDIGIGHAHGCENHGTRPVEFIETQPSTYFGKDDIARLAEGYGRS